VSGWDAIIIPGGGVREGGVLPPWSAKRFDRAMELHAGEPILCLSGGTVHRPPPLDAAGRPIFEAVAGARYLVSRGAPPELIYTEIASYDTIANALFARLMHTDPRAWKRLLVITSEFHMERTSEIFRWIFSLPPDSGYRLTFESAPDAGMTAADLNFRRAREKASLAAVRALAPRLRDIAAVHEWLFTKHKAYAADQSTPLGDAQLQRVY
jgi:hypothetical protein